MSEPTRSTEPELDPLEAEMRRNATVIVRFAIAFVFVVVAIAFLAILAPEAMIYAVPVAGVVGIGAMIATAAGRSRQTPSRAYIAQRDVETPNERTQERRAAALRPELQRAAEIMLQPLTADTQRESEENLNAARGHGRGATSSKGTELSR